jgi:hypothetical protein
MNRQHALQSYIVGLASIAVIVLTIMVVEIVKAPTREVKYWLPYAAFLLAFGVLCNTQQLYVSDSNSMTMGTVAQVATVVILPLPAAILVIGVAKGIWTTYLRAAKRRNWRSTMVNTSSPIIANTAGGLAFLSLGGGSLLWGDQHLITLLGFPAVAALGVCYHLVDIGAVTGAITLNSGERPSSVFAQVWRKTFVPEMSLMTVGVAFGLLFHFSPALSAFAVVPIYFSMRSFRAVARLQKETMAAVLKMAESIDYRDTGTYEHSERLATFCKRLARTMGLTPEHVGEVELASRVHDLGKIGISNDILLKQGPLTLQERQIMEEHPVIGASILASYSSFKESVAIVRHHHERWDGKGYPDGLSGEAIPIGSRIITVVDSFDAMTSDRPYRKGMSVREAVDRLKDGMGSQFDPRVCAGFLQLLIDDGLYVPHEPIMNLRLVGKEAG